jgi:hypothetical protein
MILSLLRAKYPLAAPDALHGRSACQVAAYIDLADRYRDPHRREYPL